jgi:hypothetical protein
MGEEFVLSRQPRETTANHEEGNIETNETAKQSKRATSLKDLKPRKDVKGGPHQGNNLKQMGIG